MNSIFYYLNEMIFGHRHTDVFENIESIESSALRSTHEFVVVILLVIGKIRQ